MITIVLHHLTDKISAEINQKKRELGLKIRISFKSNKLVHILNRVNNQRRREEGVLADTRNIVYSMRCKKCLGNTVYIGETERTLGERQKEHTSQGRKGQNQTEPAKHALLVHGFNNTSLWDTKILHRCTGLYQRKILESREIRAQKPALNRKAGIQFLKI